MSQAEELSLHASKASCLDAEVAELQKRLQQLAEERADLLDHLHAKADSMREAEHALADQQAKHAQQQRQAQDAAQASEKVPHTNLVGSSMIAHASPAMHVCITWSPHGLTV